MEVLITALQERINLLFSTEKYDEYCSSAPELSMRMSDPDFWSFSDAEKISKEYNNITTWLELHNKLCGYVDELRDLLVYADEFPDEREAVDTEILSLLNSIEIILQPLEESAKCSCEEDRLPCVLKITAGAGGTEAADWAGMLERMYLQWAKSEGFDTSVQHRKETQGGIAYSEMLLTGKNAFGVLKRESGVHRLVRVSPYNAQGKRMTSFASVFCTPLVDDSIIIELDPSKLDFDYFRSGGAGGQNVNKVSSGVRARYHWTDPDTGEEELILVENTETRDQPKNRENAIRILKSILYQKELDRRRKLTDELESSKGDNGWGNQIRSYVLDDRYVKDHRTNVVVHNPMDVLNGNLKKFIEAEISQLQ